MGDGLARIVDHWSSYGLSDFLLFAPATYYRLYELYNAAVWPAPLIGPALGLALLLAVRARSRRAGRAAAGLLAGCWLWVALAFHLERYAAINWAAPWFAAAFAGQAAALIAAAAPAGGGLAARRPAGAAGRIGQALVVFALIVQPLLGPLAGTHDWRGMELFGVAPDPTALATLGFVLAAARPRPWLLALPLAWCAASGATALAMDDPAWALMPAAGVLALALAITGRRAGWTRPAGDGAPLTDRPRRL